MPPVDHDHNVLDDRIQAAERKIVSLERTILEAIGNLDTRIENRVEKQIETLIRDIAHLGRRIDSQDEKHDATRERVVRVETKQEELEKQLSKSENVQDAKMKSAAREAVMQSKLWIYAMLFAGFAAILNILARWK